jgi:hypothetical protein
MVIQASVIRTLVFWTQVFSVFCPIQTMGVVRTPVIRTKSIWTPVSEQVMIQKKLGL